MSFLPPDEPQPGCPLCEAPGGTPIAQSRLWRVIRAEDASFPAFYRVVWREHVAEFGDLDAAARVHCMAVVEAVERVLRQRLSPTKINLAAFGNVVPHLHWHVIARFDWDSHWPQPVWAAAQRTVEPAPLQRLGMPLQELDEAVAAALNSLS
ncbi:HIT family protein [Caldimonas sp. KR1-144]|uniref:HIT family protein n=1 Tax=Caldimonas sp. KR1-144 TaxID=3400911 RepID=UPI003BFFDB8C